MFQRCSPLGRTLSQVTPDDLAVGLDRPSVVALLPEAGDLVGSTLPDTITDELAKAPERDWQIAYDADGEPCPPRQQRALSDNVA